MLNFVLSKGRVNQCKEELVGFYKLTKDGRPSPEVWSNGFRDVVRGQWFGSQWGSFQP